ncbi:dienelactone hydrolase endo-1,3,1,4-beta-D-glucanase [Gloeophyllum trabeum ATCC 11539]|uniref:Dienelactone hydrolase endo-1,3,1,4-beta-D-glucanase n=1 Tax=Gloeophyllum trabeum (strain ATCC 11539 / FP-39264 / Madison 617) TaxID=670483 RepID=S7QBC3_GLOTA|nr:dienelactone hydrolase endo-1,3,1,4-beta-D-glucanase [Gloeophyllum trabeum ATCC 11539]EPQ56648.1 dienelactone hydrolase endo-1,3,1,4-beta-D-glucanase [Gloeophyllum trabeum ATCC 11539]
MSHCDDCFKAVRHEGTPEGKIETIGGVECYVATPSGECPKNKVLLFLSDVFGLALVNNKLLADDFARNGIKTIIPDYFGGDPRIPDADERTFSREEWLSRHGPEQTRPYLDKVIAALKEQGVTDFGAAGYCFGAPYCFQLAYEGIAKAVMVAHPSRLQIPSDLEKYLELSRAPLLINSCEIDPMFPPETQAKADEILGGGKFKPGYERLYWEGCTHGFAVRGDMSNPKVKAGKEGAFKSSVEFFKKYLY